jgi:S1-C subfamily serine protease
VLGPDGKFRFRDYPVVAVVTPGSPGELAGVRAGDFILSENDRDAREGRLFATDTLGATYRVRVKRGDEILEFILTSVKMPPSAVPPRG